MSQILFPIGRLIGGSVHKLNPRTEQDGKTPKKDVSGNTLMVINFGVAIPKAGETHWSQTAWGNQIFQIGKAAFPAMHVAPSFAWKIVDGDSTIPNKNGKLPVNQTGYKGNWVIWFSQGWAPKLVNSDGTVELPGDQFVPGYYVQVLGEVTGNGATPTNTAGVYINPVAVALAGQGEKIVVDVDTTTVGFGGALPAGASPVQPVVAGFPAPASHAAPAPITPNAAFMAPPGAPSTPSPPAAPAKPQMTAKANGATYEQFVGNGWTDQMMREQGYIV